MTFEIIRDIFAWATLIHIGFLLLWVLVFFPFRDFIYRMHAGWFEISRQEFDSIHYSGMLLYKVLILVFGLVPYLAMRIVG